MRKDKLIALVGPKRYLTESAAARKDAARPDYGRGSVVDLELPHEMAEHIWWSEESWGAKIALCFAVYDDMPAYGHLMYAKQHYREFPLEERDEWWTGVRARLASGEAALRQPLQYSLWCDFFEDDATVREAWSALTGPDASPAILRAVLDASGPVPYALKAPIYERLLPNVEWHTAIGASLIRSALDAYGQLEPSAARRVLAGLKLPADLPGLTELKTRLASA